MPRLLIDRDRIAGNQPAAAPVPAGYAAIDLTGAGNVIPAFGDIRKVELLVCAGLMPLGIRIGRLKGATYREVADRIGSIAPGRHADLEAPAIVFSDGVGYDRAKLLASVAARYGRY